MPSRIRQNKFLCFQGHPPYWRILGRSSVDIIKSGGYKISALSIENALLTHPDVSECAVVGVEDEVQGQIVAAVVACNEEAKEVCNKHMFACPCMKLLLRHVAVQCRSGTKHVWQWCDFARSHLLQCMMPTSWHT